MSEDDNRYIDRTQDRKLVRLLEETAFALEEGSDTITYQYTVEYLVWWCTCKGCWRSTYTERFLSSLIALISIFLRPIIASAGADARGYRQALLRGVGQWSVRAGANWATATEGSRIHDRRSQVVVRQVDRFV